jgi:hypothetical protein
MKLSIRLIIKNGRIVSNFTFLIISTINIIFPLTCLTQNLIQKWSLKSEGQLWQMTKEMSIHHSTMILAGNFNGNSNIATASFNSDNGIFMAKVGLNGDIRLLHVIHATNYCYLSSMRYDNFQTIYATGYFKGKLSMGNFSIETKNNIEGFLVALDTNFSLKWIRKIQGEFSGQKIFLAPIDSNYCFVSTNFHGKISFCDSLYQSENNRSEILLCKIDSKGKIRKSFISKGEGDKNLANMVVDNTGRLIICGSFSNRFEFSDSLMVSVGRSDGFLMCLNNTGKVEISKQFGSQFDDYVQDVAVDVNNSIVVTGEFSKDFRLNKQLIPLYAGSMDIFICKFDEQGNLLWYDTFGSIGNDYVNSIKINKGNNIYLSGSFRGKINKGTQIIHSSTFTNNEFLAKYNSSGQFRFLESLPNGGTSYNRDLKIDLHGYLYLTGNRRAGEHAQERQSTISLKEIIHVSKFYDCDEGKKIELGNDTSLCGNAFKLIIDSTFDSYSWSDGSTGYKKIIHNSGKYFVDVIDSNGCHSKDSIKIVLFPKPELIITGPTNVSRGSVVTLETNPGMQEYKWNDNSTLSFLKLNTSILDEGDHNYFVDVIDTNRCKGRAQFLLRIEKYSQTQKIDENCNINQKSKVSVYPNPAHEKVHLLIENISLNADFYLFIYTETGNLIRKLNFITVEDSIHIDIGTVGFSPGTYIMKVIVADQIIIKKIIIL